MSFFLLRHEYPDAGFIDVDVTFTPPLADWYSAGKPLPSPVKAVDVVMDSAVRKLKADFFYTTSGAFFASERLSSLLREFQNDLELIPASSRYRKGRTTESAYALVHANLRRPGFDYALSEFAGKTLALQRLQRGEHADDFLIKGLKTIVIDASKIADANFFFLKNVLLIDPIVSTPLANAMKAHQLKIRLEPIGQTWAMAPRR